LDAGGNFRAPHLLPRGAVDAPIRADLDSIPTKSLGIEDPPLTAPTTELPTLQPPAATATGAAAAAATLHARPVFHGTGAVAFSTKGEYGVRLMVQLGRRYGQGPASLAEISTSEDLPRAYLEQLAFVLRDAGLVTSTRGARGGYALTREPAAIPMSEILRALEGPLAPMICATDDPAHAIDCDRTSTCTVNYLWIRVRDAIAGALATMTLADLVPQRHPGQPAPAGVLTNP
jgi:Rrf2 family cysteine metabolism transcriptional repressor